MNKLIPFHKSIELKTSIGEITSIALDKEIKVNNNNTITGSFTISGSYKMLKTSTKEEEFSYDIPIDITMDDQYDLNEVKVDIDDFYYDIINDNLDVSIDLLIDNIKEKNIEKIEIIEDVIKPIKENDIPFLKKKDEILDLDEVREEKIIKEVNNTKQEDKKVNSLFTKFLDDDDTYSTYKVYIVREQDTLESIMEKYNVTRDDLEDYNNLNDISINDKIVIPCKNEKN